MCLAFVVHRPEGAVSQRSILAAASLFDNRAFGPILLHSGNIRKRELSQRNQAAVELAMPIRNLFGVENATIAQVVDARAGRDAAHDQGVHAVVSGGAAVLLVIRPQHAVSCSGGVGAAGVADALAHGLNVSVDSQPDSHHVAQLGSQLRCAGQVVEVRERLFFAGLKEEDAALAFSPVKGFDALADRLPALPSRQAGGCGLAWGAVSHGLVDGARGQHKVF